MCAGVHGGSIWAKSKERKKYFQEIRDKDGEHAKKCLDLSCGKIFYVGDECPFCRAEIVEQNLIKAICPNCKKKVKNIGGAWIEVVNFKALPPRLPEERCPSCTLDELNNKKNDCLCL